MIKIEVNKGEVEMSVAGELETLTKETAIMIRAVSDVLLELIPEEDKKDFKESLKKLSEFAIDAEIEKEEQNEQ